MPDTYRGCINLWLTQEFVRKRRMWLKLTTKHRRECAQSPFYNHSHRRMQDDRNSRCAHKSARLPRLLHLVCRELGHFECDAFGKRERRRAHFVRASSIPFFFFVTVSPASFTGHELKTRLHSRIIVSSTISLWFCFIYSIEKVLNTRKIPL